MGNQSLKTKRFYFPESQGWRMEPPDLIEVQKNSYEWFLKEGLKELFDEINPIKDYIGRDLELYFLDYYLDEPKFDEVVARDRNITFEAALRVKTKLINKRNGEIKEQEVYLVDFPLMTDRGTFIVNGIERVIISQLIRSPGVFFSSETINGKRYYGAKIIPNRGAWLEIETAQNGVINVKIDRKRKVPVTSLLKAFGYTTNDEIKDLFKDVDTLSDFKYIQTTLDRDPAKTEVDGLREVYKRIRPGDLATTDNARQLIHSMFFNFERYDFGKVGRYKLNQRFKQDCELTKENRILKKQDLVDIIKEIISLNINQKPADDIDHLGNRRIRAVGELIQNRFRLGLARMERSVVDKMSTADISGINPAQLINTRPIMGAVKEFFMSSQLSQFMDQTNLLAELEHKRRISAMGPGGLSRERAGFEVRDVHRTHYGRICPIATPEGPNIGLVGHLSTYARINNFGFLETPYRKVDKQGKKPRVTEEVVYLDAFVEEKSVTTSSTAPIDENGYFTEDKTGIRQEGEPILGEVEEIDYADVAPNQIISVATSLIPFLEHDDAVRALMGTNMQKQAVPVVRPTAPLVATGMERRAAIDSGQVLVATSEGEVQLVQSNKIVILQKDGNMVTYNLTKFIRSNASTCLNQRAVVEKGQKVKPGDVLADASACDKGELALGQNLLVAFMPWEGGNYEDAILISERLVHNDKYTSIHIADYTIDVRETKLGPEVVTRDIPNIGEDKLKNLDEEGVVRIGAEVSSGDILVGKITPKGETELTAEERLLRAIFGEKAKEVRDSSLYLEHGEHGKVLDIKVFSRDKGDKLSAGVIKQVQVMIAHMRKIQVGDKMAGRHGNKGVISRIVAVEDMPRLPDGRPVDIILNPLGVSSRMNLGQILETHLGMIAHQKGLQIATPALNGVREETIKKELSELGISPTGKMKLIDGRSGEPFQYDTTVGYIYMLKLVHMVEDKIHQRSIGPYSLVTQQPLGGKAQFGGQRFGEMEVWALEAYGAAYILQEILTIKSDDVPGRSKSYESIIKGEPISKLNIPESFNVLVRELKGLGLDVELLREGELVKEQLEESDEDQDQDESVDSSQESNKKDKQEKSNPTDNPSVNQD